MNVLIYVVCQNEESEQQASTIQAKQPWARIVKLAKSDQKDSLQENVMFLNELPFRKHEWFSKDFVGTISWKAQKKMNLDRLDSYIMQPSQDDAVFFTCLGGTIQKRTEHPHLTQLWEDICVKCLKLPHCKVSQSNLWMCRPALMIQWLDFFANELWPTLKSHPLTWTDAKYSSGRHSIEDIKSCNNGRPQQTHVPFLLERVPRNYFLAKNVRVTCL